MAITVCVDHCALYVNSSTAMLTDLGTTNGTYVDGCRITTHELHHLSEFHIGNSTLMFTVTTGETVVDASQDR